MILLFDTHTLLWWITDSPRLSEDARSLMGSRHTISRSSGNGAEQKILY